MVGTDAGSRAQVEGGSGAVAGGTGRRWGGCTGGGQFTLRLWTERPTMTKEQWWKHIPALKQAVVTKRKHAQSKRVLQAATKSGHIRPGHVVEGVVAGLLGS